jgi:hypothetical protein
MHINANECIIIQAGIRLGGEGPRVQISPSRRLTDQELDFSNSFLFASSVIIPSDGYWKT